MLVGNGGRHGPPAAWNMGPDRALLSTARTSVHPRRTVPGTCGIVAKAGRGRQTGKLRRFSPHAFKFRRNIFLLRSCFGNPRFFGFFLNFSKDSNRLYQSRLLLCNTNLLPCSQNPLAGFCADSIIFIPIGDFFSLMQIGTICTNCHRFTAGPGNFQLAFRVRPGPVFPGLLLIVAPSARHILPKVARPLFSLESPAFCGEPSARFIRLPPPYIM